jgi:xylose isomerase
MRYYTNPAFKRGAFTNPDPAVRREAIDLTKRGIDAARAMGAPMMTLWLGRTGMTMPSSATIPQRLWADEVDAIAEVANHDPDCLISIEYKPNEPRSYCLCAMPRPRCWPLTRQGATTLA